LSHAGFVMGKNLYPAGKRVWVWLHTTRTRIPTGKNYPASLYTFHVISAQKHNSAQPIYQSKLYIFDADGSRTLISFTSSLLPTPPGSRRRFTQSHHRSGTATRAARCLILFPSVGGDSSTTYCQANPFSNGYSCCCSPRQGWKPGTRTFVSLLDKKSRC
jgi:hypothetical protein